MKIKRKLLITILGLGFTALTHSAPIDPRAAQVAGASYDDGGRAAENMSNIYWGRTTFYIPASFNSVEFRIPGTDSQPSETATYDLGAIIRSAFAEWRVGVNILQRGPGFTETQTRDYAGIDFALNHDANLHWAGYTSLTTPLDTIRPTRITISPESLGATARQSYESAIIDHAITRQGMSLQRFLLEFIRNTVRHEIGHAFGLMHSDTYRPSIYEAPLNPAALGTNIVPGVAGSDSTNHPPANILIVAGHRNDAPSIMVTTFASYLSYLSVHLGRPVTHDDLHIPANDLRAAANIWRGTVDRSVAGSLGYNCVGACLQFADDGVSDSFSDEL